MLHVELLQLARAREGQVREAKRGKAALEDKRLPTQCGLGEAQSSRLCSAGRRGRPWPSRQVPQLLRARARRAAPLTGTRARPGGTGGLGLLAAAWLRQAGARCALLLGRSGRAAGAGDAAALASLGSAHAGGGACGCLVRAARADVAGWEEAGAAAAAGRRRAPRLTGLLHAAGVQVRPRRRTLPW